MTEEEPVDGWICDDAGDVMEMLRECPFWLLLSRSGQPDIKSPRIYCAPDTPPQDPPPASLILDIQEHLQQGETVLLALKHESHRLVTAVACRRMGWTVALVPNEPTVVH